MVIKKISAVFRKGENYFAYGSLLLLAVFPFMEIIARIFKTGIPGSSDYTSHLILWVTFIGGMITSREKRHLSLSAGVDFLKGGAKSTVETIVALISATFASTFFWSALSYLFIGFDPSKRVGIIPVQIVFIIMPIGYAVMAIRFIMNDALSKIGKRIAAFGLVLGLLIAFPAVLEIVFKFIPDYPLILDTIYYEIYYPLAEILVWPLFFILIAAAIMGTPLFIVLGGIAYIFFASAWGAPSITAHETRIILTSSTIAAIPLFSLAGFILSESGAGKRLIRVFQAFFGWMPGGMAIVAVLVCTFFTTFTGASGVTILALGGLLAYILGESGKYKKSFVNGLLTSSGSIGLLFPPSLPIILYGVVAGVSIKKMFLGGIIPGIIMVTALSVMGIMAAVKSGVKPVPFKLSELFPAVKGAAGELLLPVIILLGIFRGVTTIIETGAVAVIYLIILEVFITKEIKYKDLGKVILKAIPIIGGVLIILSAAKGISYFIVDAEIPMHLTAWVEANIHSKYTFLILLNIALLLTGCLMDIFSAIMVVVPLILPLGKLFGIDPVHLGIIFLANLELGYLTPPVGLNLFLASYRFNQPLGKIYKNVIPFFLVLLVMVLLITYVPWFSTVFVSNG